MRRIALIAAATVAVLGGLVNVAADEVVEGDKYLVRAYFDNAGFLVKSEEVRVAGAKVGTIAEVDVSRPGETVTEEGEAVPGKAVAVLEITDPAFQDFRTDAACLIRPQSLLGEKFVECEPTQPRAASSEAPPPLEVIPEGERGAGQRFLPIENNGKAVDLDLLNNITREPERDRFRLILNELGAGLAARGKTLGEVIERANPALRETDEVLKILADQNQGLADLARDSDTVLEPLARERESLGSFIRNATTTARATANERDALEQTFQELPPALDELETTMVELSRFARAGTPLARDLGEAAPSLTRATRELGPFSKAGTTALTSLGTATETVGPDLVASNPLLRDLRGLAESTAPGAKSLQRLLGSIRRTGGIDQAMAFVLGSSNTFNGYDEFGHFLRATLLVTNCVDYRITPLSGCGANWSGASASAASAGSPSPLPTPGILRGPDPAKGSDGGAGELEDQGGKGSKGKGGEATATAGEIQPSLDLLDYLTRDEG